MRTEKKKKKGIDSIFMISKLISQAHNCELITI